ncbi:Uma2 family endonuclease [Limnofasciculus baicalensis]|uniref:Uma2 family endonuclease n=1 Tax=Limnofasciculus baicalensis BBK-W-15 TaxID=2699891 RepID=A0AAE3GVJ7_9CYAN|nr:Uma2 family endonuclease [Limnofasciculus baicalensis]MCP2729367.1 Uma2 family endonuclease [Limnofasciculus baicalensis BBK-W-15]
MIQAIISKLMTFDDFLKWKPENGHYELHNGVIVEMQTTGKHEEVVEFLQTELTLETRRLQLSYRFPRNALVKSPSQETGYLPDILVVKGDALVLEPLWEKSSTITQGSSIPLIIEVVSTNWRDDYAHKMIDYEALGIPEYWIVDYLGLGGSRYIGSPKQPTLSVYQLVDGEYQIKLFRGDERVESLVFSEFNLTAKQIFNGG